MAYMSAAQFRVDGDGQPAQEHLERSRRLLDYLVAMPRFQVCPAHVYTLCCGASTCNMWPGSRNLPHEAALHCRLRHRLSFMVAVTSQPDAHEQLLHLSLLPQRHDGRDFALALTHPILLTNPWGKQVGGSECLVHLLNTVRTTSPHIASHCAKTQTHACSVCSHAAALLRHRAAACLPHAA